MRTIVEQPVAPGGPSAPLAVVDRTVRAERTPKSAAVGARDGAHDIAPFVVAIGALRDGARRRHRRFGRV